MIKPKKKVVKTEQWDCGNPSHNHKTEAVAQRCINRTARKVTRATEEEKRSRMLAVFRMVCAGSTLKDAGAAFGVSADSVSLMLRMVYRLCASKNVTPERWPYEFDPGSPSDFRRNSSFWLGKANDLENYWSKQAEKHKPDD